MQNAQPIDDAATTLVLYPGIWKKIWRVIARMTGAIWCWFSDLLYVLKPSRFSVLMVLLISVLLIMVPQCQEALRSLAERNEVIWLRLTQWLCFFGAALLVALNAWYWSRQMLNIEFASSKEDSPRRLAMRRMVPRLCGTVALAAVTVALWQANKAYQPGESGEAATAHHFMNNAIACSAALTSLFFLFVQFRRRLFHAAWVTRKRSVNELPRLTWWLLGLSAALAFILFLAFWIVPLWLGPLLGAPSILLLAAATWIPFGSFCVYVGMRYEFSALTLLLVAAVVFGYWNDNHQVRVISDPNDVMAQALAPIARKSVDDVAHAWLAARQKELAAAQAAHQKYPVFIVAAAGGGIRAAYWTATLLAGLEDRYPGQFSHHTFGISGVSGGSVGSAAFVGLLAEKQAGHIQYRQGNNKDCDGLLRPWACAVLSQDFLAPVTGSMLYTDLTQRFLPFAVPSFDRARTLEKSWQRAWRSQGLEGDRMAQPFAALWLDDHNLELPLLFLNSTVVESGRRAIVSPVKIDGDNFLDALDAVDAIQQPMPLSTAAHLSARFTYLSPAGTVPATSSHYALHLVDGGYFENGGIFTADEVATAFGRAAQAQQISDAVCIKVLVISNSQNYVADGKSYDGQPIRFMTEALAPIQAVFNGVDSRARFAEAELQARHQAILFGLKQRPNQAVLPLGWMLSDVAQHEIDQQVAQTINGSDSAASVGRMLSGETQCP